ncbi:MAG: ROK family protein [Candidatus Omnitrophica bacterium]|nr:ROK family protein [Candidatus Omnitrophota bacterium]
MSKVKKIYSIGIDVGGTKMSAVLFDGNNLIADYVLATPTDDLDHFMVMLKALIKPLEERARDDKVKIRGIGLGIAGTIDYHEGIMLSSRNIPIIKGVKIANKLEEIASLPVAMDNDANCFVRAEVAHGAGQKYKNVFGVIIGTGIGGGWWINNEVYRGVHGGAGEPGKIIVDFKTGLGLEDAYHKLTQDNPAKMAEEAFRGDKLAQEAFREVGRNIGIALAGIVNIIDPEIFVIGGGAVESSGLFLSEMKKAMREHVGSNESKKKIKIVKSKIGPQAGAIGAALLVNMDHGS